MAALEDILGRRNLTAVFQTTLRGIPRFLPASFYAPSRRVSGNQATITKYDGMRKHASVVRYGAKAKIVEKKGMNEQPVTLLHSFEQMQYPGSVLLNLREFDSEAKQNLGRTELARQSMDFAERFNTLRTVAIQSAIFTGYVYFDENGQALPSSSGALIAVDYGIPAANKGQLDIEGGGAAIAASWATTTTDIQAHMTAIKRQALAKTNIPIRHAFHGANIRTYLRANDNLQIQMQSNSDLARNIGGTGDFEWENIIWHDASAAYWIDDSGTIRRWVGDDTIVFLPEPSPSWYELIEGSSPVPNDINVAPGDLTAAADNITEAWGPTSWARVDFNPVTLEQFFTDTFLPVIGNPNAVFIADVTP